MMNPCGSNNLISLIFLRDHFIYKLNSFNEIIRPCNVYSEQRTTLILLRTAVSSHNMPMTKNNILLISVTYYTLYESDNIIIYPSGIFGKESILSMMKNEVKKSCST
jgi:hypothetical protein